jgi:hypothetical protein
LWQENLFKGLFLVRDMQKLHHEIFTIAILDVSNILPFSKPESAYLTENAKALDEVFTQLSLFKSTLEQHLGRRLVELDQENRDGKHIVRFFFEGHEGLVEVIIERPTAINFYFVKKKDALHCLAALRSTLHALLPHSTARELLVGSLHVSTGIDEKVTVKKHSIMHDIYVYNGVKFIGVSFIIFLGLQLMEELLNWVFGVLFPSLAVNQFIFVVIYAIVIAGLFERIQRFVEHAIAKLL